MKGINIEIKICGIKDLETAKFAVECGASYVGFIFYPKSPRNVNLEMARVIGEYGDLGAKKAAVTVDASDDELTKIIDSLRPDYLQLHGDESPERVLEVKKIFSLPIIKAIAVESISDIDYARDHYDEVVDMLLLDTKVENLPGGSGKSFDWDILNKQNLKSPWFLSGGINLSNVEKALNFSQRLDVSSGLEKEKGIKDLAMIKKFMEKIYEIYSTR